MSNRLLFSNKMAMVNARSIHDSKDGQKFASRCLL